MSRQSTVAHLARLLPLQDENRWSDLLAALITTDAEPARSLLGLPAGHITVDRERAISRTNRPDIVLHVNETLHTVIEAKVLAGLGAAQLERYRESTQDAHQHVLTFLETLPLRMNDEAWRVITWEDWARAYADSSHPWCSHTGRGWIAHLHQVVPIVTADTPWNALPEGIPFAVSIRARVAWLREQIHPPANVDIRLATSSSGNSAILEFDAATKTPGYSVECNLEELLDVREWPTAASASTEVQPKGPKVSIQLVQYDITTSKDYQWKHLAALWPTLEQSGIAWQTRAPSTRIEHDKAGVQSLVDAGVPRYVGRGFGDRMAKMANFCAFGPVCHLPAESRLGEIAAFLERCAELVVSLSDIPSPR